MSAGASAPTPGNRLLFAGLVALGMSQVFSFLYLSAHSRDFVIEQVNAQTGAQVASVEMVPGQWLGFGRSEPGGILLGAGWHAAEDAGVWSRHREAWLMIPVPAPQRSRALEIRGRGFVAPRHPSVTVTVSCGPRAIVEWRLDTRNDAVASTVPLDACAPAAPEPLELSIKVDNPGSPWRSGIGQDGRTLGFFLERIRLVDPPVGAGARDDETMQ